MTRMNNADLQAANHILRQELDEAKIHLKTLHFGFSAAVNDRDHEIAALKKTNAELSAQNLQLADRIKEIAHNCPSCGRHDFGFHGPTIAQIREAERLRDLANKTLEEMVEKFNAAQNARKRAENDLEAERKYRKGVVDDLHAQLRQEQYKGSLLLNLVATFNSVDEYHRGVRPEDQPMSVEDICESIGRCMKNFYSMRKERDEAKETLRLMKEDFDKRLSKALPMPDVTNFKSLCAVLEKERDTARERLTAKIDECDKMATNAIDLRKQLNETIQKYDSLQYHHDQALVREARLIKQAEDCKDAVNIAVIGERERLKDLCGEDTKWRERIAPLIDAVVFASKTQIDFLKTLETLSKMNKTKDGRTMRECPMRGCIDIYTCPVGRPHLCLGTEGHCTKGRHRESCRPARDRV